VTGARGRREHTTESGGFDCVPRLLPWAWSVAMPTRAHAELDTALNSPDLATTHGICPGNRRSRSPSDRRYSPPRGGGLAGCVPARHGRQSRRRHVPRRGRAVEVRRGRPITRPSSRASGNRTVECGAAHGLCLPTVTAPRSSDPPSPGTRSIVGARTLPQRPVDGGGPLNPLVATHMCLFRSGPAEATDSRARSPMGFVSGVTRCGDAQCPARGTSTTVPSGNAWPYIIFGGWSGFWNTTVGPGADAVGSGAIRRDAGVVPGPRGCGVRADFRTGCGRTDEGRAAEVGGVEGLTVGSLIWSSGIAPGSGGGVELEGREPSGSLGADEGAGGAVAAGSGAACLDNVGCAAT
jgi:hypothetical protein